MKKILAWAPAAFAAVALTAGCQKSTASESQTTEPVAKTRTIEQFMDTASIGGSAFSPDPAKILYPSNQAGVYSAFEVPGTESEPRQLTSSTENPAFTISYSPKDERILYPCDKGSHEILYMRQPDGSAQALAPEGNAKAADGSSSKSLRKTRNNDTASTAQHA